MAARWSSGVTAFPCSSEVIREAATVDRTANPTDAPICLLLLTRPDARPASSRRTPPVADRAIGVKASPMPKVLRIPPIQTPGQ